MFEIDTGHSSEPPRAKSAWVEGNGRVSWRGDSVKAERFHRQTIAALWGCETPQEVDAHLAAESLLIDALWMDWPDYAARIDAAADEIRAILRGQESAKADPCSTASSIPSAQGGNNEKDDNDDFFF